LSLPAKAIFAGILAIEFLFIGLIGRNSPWAWMILITLPAILWYFSSEQKILKNIMIHFLDEIAKNNRFKKVVEAPDSPARYKPVEN